MKIARLTPLFKEGDKSAMGNYRPISVLSCFSKFFEKIMYNWLYKHLIDSNILYKTQFCFQENRSAEHANYQLID